MAQGLYLTFWMLNTGLFITIVVFVVKTFKKVNEINKEISKKKKLLKNNFFFV